MHTYFDVLPALRVALVQDALPVMGGAERVLAEALEVFPQADLFALVHHPPAFAGTPLAGRPVRTGFINRLPGARQHYRSYLPLFPLAIEQLDLRGYDLILSFSYAVAHGALARPDQLHLSYVHTPLRQAWHQYQDFLDAGRRGPLGAPPRWAAMLILHYLRQWSCLAASRVDQFAAPSAWVQRGIWRAFGRRAEVLPPPVAVERFSPAEEREAYFISVARLEPHKRLDLVIQAFNRLGLPLVLVGAGSERGRLERLAGPGVRLLGPQPDAAVQALLGRARAFVMAGEEDFGIAAVEAQAAGCPVIAYRGGGAAETVVDGLTGLLYAEQSAESLAEAVTRFIHGPHRFETHALVQQARRFSRENFKARLRAWVQRAWSEFQPPAPAGLVAERQDEDLRVFPL